MIRGQDLGISVPVRACVAGENLDWMGGLSLCVAVDLPTRVVKLSRAEWARWPHRATTESLEAFVMDALGPMPARNVRIGAICTAPSPSGLGTSSSIAIAILEAMKLEFAIRDASSLNLAFEYELRDTHGGGMDHLSITRGGWLLTSGNDGSLPEVVATGTEAVDSTLRVLMVNTGIDKQCKQGVAQARAWIGRSPGDARAYRTVASEVAERGLIAWQSDSVQDLRACLDAAHEAMRDIARMSSPAIEDLRESLRLETGVGFKLSGSGGGGCLFTFCSSNQLDELTLAVRSMGVAPRDVYSAPVSGGIRVD